MSKLLASTIQVREVRVLSFKSFLACFWSLLGVCIDCMLLWTCGMPCVVIWIWKMWLCRENRGEIWYSHPSEPVSPRRDLQKQARSILKLSLRRRTLVLSEVLYRSSERRSPKRERVGALACCCSLSPDEGWPRSSEEGSSKRAFTKPPRASVAISPKRESATQARAPFSPGRVLLARARCVAGQLFFLTWLLLVVWLVGLLYLKYEACDYAWNIWGYEFVGCVGMILACETNGMVGNESGMVLVWDMI